MAAALVAGQVGRLVRSGGCGDLRAISEAVLARDASAAAAAVEAYLNASALRMVGVCALRWRIPRSSTIMETTNARNRKIKRGESKTIKLKLLRFSLIDDEQHHATRSERESHILSQQTVTSQRSKLSSKSHKTFFIH